MTTILTIAAYTWGILILSFILLGFWVTIKGGAAWLEEKGFIATEEEL